MGYAETTLRKLGITNKITRTHLDAFLKKYATSKKTLDVGCSTGPYATYFPNRTGLDIKKTPAVDIVADCHDLHMIGDEEFDCVLCTEVLEHLHTPQQAIDEFHRVLKSGGILILTTRFIYPLHDVPHDYYRFTRYGLEHLLRAFRILELNEETDTLGTLGVLLQRIGFQTDTLRCKPLRLIWLLLAKLLQHFPSILTAQYGEVQRTTRISNIITSGYHVACVKV